MTSIPRTHINEVIGESNFYLSTHEAVGHALVILDRKHFAREPHEPFPACRLGRKDTTPHWLQSESEFENN